MTDKGPGFVKEGDFIFPIRVYFEDTDAAGIVYHSNYINFMERGRTEMSRAAGVSHSESFLAGKTFFVVRGLKIEYLQAGKLDDLLHVSTRIDALGKIRMDLTQMIRRDEVVLAKAQVNLVNVNQERRPARIPLPFRQKVEQYFKENANE